MGSRPRTIALRDQLITTLRESQSDLSTPELAARTLPWPIVTMHGTCAAVHSHVENYQQRLILCNGPGAHRIAVWPFPAGVYPHLCWLESAGFVARSEFSSLDLQARLARVAQENERGNYRPVYWRYVDNQTDREFNAILAALENTDA